MEKNKFLLSLLLIYSFLLAKNSIAQENRIPDYFDINKVELVKSMYSSTSSVYTDLQSNIEKEYPRLKFEPYIIHKGQIPNKYVTKKLLLKFNICNVADTSNSIYFFPGFYFKNIQLYKVKGSKIQKLPNILPNNPDSLGFRMLTLNAFDSATILAELTFLKTYINTIRPRLINSNYTNTFIAEVKITNNRDNILTNIFCGLLLMMLLYTLANFFQTKNREFLYYSCYATFIGLMLFSKSFYNFRISKASFFLESYLDFMLMGIGVVFYMAFMKIFLNTRSKYPFLFKLYNSGIALLILSLVTYTIFHFYTNDFGTESLIENATKLFLLIYIIIFLIYSLKYWKDKLLRYIIWGNFYLLVFSIISFIAISDRALFANFSGVFVSSLFYYELGLVLELLFFLTALNYKNNKRIIAETKERENLKVQNKLKEYEKELAVYKAQQEERHRISADMHDELGSGMTVIRLMSEIARSKMKENTPVEIDKISTSADDILNKMNAIIWSMDNNNDTLDNLISYIRVYAIEYFENTQIECLVKIPENIPIIEISGDKRRNVFLPVKETLNNVLKHSNATSVYITIEVNEKLRIVIYDNGQGIDIEKTRKFGNGLKNIAKRMETIGGKFSIENKNGTVSVLELPL